MLKSRKFIYVIENTSREIYKMLQNIECKYHIITEYDSELHGFIYLHSKTSEESIQKKLNSENVYSTEDDSFDIITDLKNQGKYWETGSIRKYKQKHKLNITNEIYNDLLQHNNSIITTLVNTVIDSKTYLQEQNSRLEKALIDKPLAVQHTMTNSHNGNNDNSKNKKITNINVFLNTECKDAITLKDFVSNLVVTDDDLECMKQLGYVESVTRLLKRSLSEYELNERPIHCTDVKREVLHVKDQEGWKKETSAGESPNIDRAFKQLTHIHRRKMTDTYKGVDPESKEFEEKAKVMYQIASSGGTEEDKYKKRIIKNISDEIRLPN